MKKSVFILIFFVTGAYGYTGYELKKMAHSGITVSSPKKKVLVLTSIGGGGHISAAKAIQTYLQQDYQIEVVNIFRDTLGGFDPIRLISFDYYTGEDFYNWLLTRNLVWFVNQLVGLGAWHMRWKKDSLAQTISDCFEHHKPDMIISVVPLINGAILQAAKEHNIPFLMIPTDLNGDKYVHDLGFVDYGKFHYFMAFDDEQMYEQIAQTGLKKDQITVAGFPIRPSFFEHKDTAAIKRRFGIPRDKPVVMVLMGAAGSKACFRYVRRLSKNDLPLHIIACIGRNEGIRQRIETITFPSHITISVIGFTDQIADLMAVSDLLITKPGTVSFCEALYMNVPILLDNIYGELAVEAFNLEFTKKYNIGDVITSYKQINSLVERHLTDESYVATIKENLKSLKKVNFAEQLRTTVAHFIGG